MPTGELINMPGLTGVIVNKVIEPALIFKVSFPLEEKAKAFAANIVVARPDGRFIDVEGVMKGERIIGIFGRPNEALKDRHELSFIFDDISLQKTGNYSFYFEVYDYLDPERKPIVTKNFAEFACKAAA